MPEMTLREALVAVRELLADESRWTQGAYARSVNGNDVKPRDPRAVCWCVSGAGRRVCRSREIRQQMSAAFRNGSKRAASLINDRSTHAEVLARLDAAIERCGG